MLLDADTKLSEQPYVPPPTHRNEILLYVLIAVVGMYVIVSLYLIHDMRTRLADMEKKQQTLEIAQVELGNRMHQTSSEFKEALTSEVGMTKQELDRRAAELDRQQRAAAAKFSAEQNQQGKQIAAVSGEVSGVKTDVGAAKTDIQRTQTDLAATNAKLERAIGDLGVQSGLIAHTASELEALKRKGDRNYYDFTLTKGARTPVSTVSLQLKKVDPKKSKFTLNVMADDRTIEKKDRTIGEPLQFYTGRDKMLYEVVVFTASKNSITGYLATPKTAPTSVSQ
jgi:hypothetical protein